MCKLSVCANSDALVSKIGECLLNMNQFCTQDKIIHRSLEAQTTFDQFGKRKDASTRLALSTEKN